MKFIHAADLHVDSPLRGLEAYEGAPADRLRGATRGALENLVRLAVDERVEFVVIAGDLFDGPWRDVGTGLWTADQLRRLTAEGIRVYLIRGNHDAASEVRRALRWPEGVRELPVDKPDTVLDEQAGAAIHGQGFARREVLEDISDAYPDPVPGVLNVGVLHTSLTGNPQHDPYAPTSPDLLVAKGYDYWALGHVHERIVVREDPWIVFSGNTQGRHARETGAKGCYLVTVDDARVEAVEFRETDVARWYRSEVRLEREDGEEELLEAVRDSLVEHRAKADGRLAAVRVVVQGACRAAAAVRDPAGLTRLIAEIRNTANDVGDVWIEKVLVDLFPPVDRADVLAAEDLAAELVRAVQDASDSEETIRELAVELGPLVSKHAAPLLEAGVDLEDVDVLRRLLGAAEERLVAGLWEGDE